jgi:hypothetical protein
MLAEEVVQDGDGETEVLIFKCVNMGVEADEEMAFELIDEGHGEYQKALSMFKDDFEALEIEV